MTNYVLNSGNVKKHPELAKKFFAEVAEGLGPAPRILICSFAQPRQDWERVFAEDVAILPGFFPEGTRPEFELAFPERFEEQVRGTEAIYIHGGDDHLVQYWLHRYELPKLWEGKTVATNSASSNALAKYFWTCDWRACMDGLGILPIKFLPHFESEYGIKDPRGPIDWKAAYDELRDFGEPSLPIHALREGEFIVLKQ